MLFGKYKMSLKNMIFVVIGMHCIYAVIFNRMLCADT
uniref:Uncharacterized protein n=1 Tax=Anguilla anguilla TaxID=7936 RepID=A0A0E9TJN1_ANGAN